MKESLKTGTAVRRLIVLVLSAVLPLARAQISPPSDGGTNSSPSPPITGPPPGRTLVDLQILHIGTLRLELFDRDKPATVGNFLHYIFSGAYSNSFLHRSATNFVVQGGSLQLVSFGDGSQAIAPVEEFEAVTNELAVGQLFSNMRGTIALAHENGDTNVATSHWFINLADNTWLDAPDTNGAYVVFGRVISGLELLDQLDPGSPQSLVNILDLGGWLEELPVPAGVTAQNVAYTNLLTTQFQIVALDMHLQIAPQPEGTMQVSWQSQSNKWHTVEWTAALGTTWQTLWTTNGNGSVQSVIDTDNPLAQMRFYRVKYQ